MLSWNLLEPDRARQLRELQRRYIPQYNRRHDAGKLHELLGRLILIGGRAHMHSMPSRIISGLGGIGLMHELQRRDVLEYYRWNINYKLHRVLSGIIFSWWRIVM